MPAKKPRGLIQRHDTAAEKAARVDREEALKPHRDLTARVPARLKGHEFAGEIWQEVIRTYNAAEAEIVTRFDLHQLIDYCILMEQAKELDEMRAAKQVTWGALNVAFIELRKTATPEQLFDAAIKLQNIEDGLVKLDARVERKRALLKQYRESLYLTPRTRAGTAPVKKDDPIPPDDMENLLNQVDEAIHGDKK